MVNMNNFSSPPCYNEFAFLLFVLKLSRFYYTIGQQQHRRLPLDLCLQLNVICINRSLNVILHFHSLNSSGDYVFYLINYVFSKCDNDTIVFGDCVTASDE